MSQIFHILFIRHDIKSHRQNPSQNNRAVVPTSMKPEHISPPASELEVLVEEGNSCLRLIEGARSKMADVVVRFGLILLKAREQHLSGFKQDEKGRFTANAGFQKWVEGNFNGLQVRSAERYMNAARNALAQVAGHPEKIHELDLSVVDEVDLTGRKLTGDLYLPPDHYSGAQLNCVIDFLESKPKRSAAKADLLKAEIRGLNRPRLERMVQDCARLKNGGDIIAAKPVKPLRISESERAQQVFYPLFQSSRAVEEERQAERLLLQMPRRSEVDDATGQIRRLGLLDLEDQLAGHLALVRDALRNLKEQ